MSSTFDNDCVYDLQARYDTERDWHSVWKEAARLMTQTIIRIENPDSANCLTESSLMNLYMGAAINELQLREKIMAKVYKDA